MAKILLNKKNATKLIIALNSTVPEEAIDELIVSLEHAESTNEFSVEGLLERLDKCTHISPKSD